MNREEIQEKANIILTHAEFDLEVEGDKLEFKSKWYNLKDEEQIYKFIKLATAIVNSIGLDGYIIFGYDPKEPIGQRFKHTTFKDSNLPDVSHLVKLFARRCSETFHIDCFDLVYEGNHFSLVHIPPIIYKPITIPGYKTFEDGKPFKEEPHRIFVRKGTSNVIATKNDIELMYYDRKNFQSEYEYYIDILNRKYRVQNPFSENKINIHNSYDIEFIIENLGRRNIIVIKSSILVKCVDGIEFKLEGLTKYLNNQTGPVGSYISIVKHGSTEILHLIYSESHAERKITEFKHKSIILEITLSTGISFSKIFEL
ncbi:MAG TPA: ATP-binding protein [Saprospiraceae bacterium]|nr:ATP-binding protein [Saprospiraceae bacterium]